AAWALTAEDSLPEARRRRVGHEVAARADLGPRDRLERVIGDAKLRRIEGEHRRIAANCAGEQKFERRRRAILSTDMRRLADEEFVSALLALDQFVELSDRGHLDLDKTLRSLRSFFFRICAIATLACLGEFFQFGKAITDFGHTGLPKRCEEDPLVPAKAGTQS